ncbi:hypothetical protein E2I00_017082 [Balaenoptera physalus]|uniref:Uncharacterized protein n=1 Tax=Balaenoptera physalus TaxID=9770 RepID=A0A643BMJ8_BALPH|nr:hypothetical protein E2I00_017082 [Balaenoptera physalus]
MWAAPVQHTEEKTLARVWAGLAGRSLRF